MLAFSTSIFGREPAELLAIAAHPPTRTPSLPAGSDATFCSLRGAIPTTALTFKKICYTISDGASGNLALAKRPTQTHHFFYRSPVESGLCFHWPVPPAQSFKPYSLPFKPCRVIQLQNGGSWHLQAPPLGEGGIGRASRPGGKGFAGATNRRRPRPTRAYRTDRSRVADPADRG